MNDAVLSKACSLCNNELSHQPISDGDRSFCCAGCHAVFNILSAKNQLVDFQESPIFQQALRTGLISNPKLLEQIRLNRMDVPEQELKKLYLEVNNMWCPACAEIIRLILMQKKGVRNCVVDYSTDLASVEYAPRYISKDSIFESIESLGYQPVDLDKTHHIVSSSLYFRFIIAVFFSLNIMMFAYPLYASYYHQEAADSNQLFAWLSGIAALPVLGYSAWPIFRRFITSLQVGIYGMETLVVIGVSSAFGLSVYNLWQGVNHVYFDSMTAIITFVLLGKMIETKAKFSAKDALKRLNRSLPRRGRKRFDDGSAAFVPVKEIESGDLVAAFSGEMIVLDGIVVEGEGTCDESLMTGEVLPISKKMGSKVIGGSILQQGSIVYQTTNRSEGSALQKILNMVQEEISHKTVYVRAADVIVQWFVPFILLVSLLTFLGCLWFGVIDSGKSLEETALIRAIAVLLISCPCAIGIAAPLAESHVLNGMASLGAIVRNRGCLSLLGKESVFLFDKTGTVTEGFFTILYGLEVLSERQRALLKGLAMQSNHLISRAIAQAIPENPLPLLHVEELIGKGMRAVFQDAWLHLGSAEFMRQLGITPTEVKVDRLDPIHSIVYFAIDGKCVSCIVLGDRIRENVQEVIKSLHPAKLILLSGDSESVVKAVAHSCGFSEWHSECSPLQKKEFVESLRKQGLIVCMLGDGINDAPALTSAHVGISVVSATDLSIQVSDILLTTDRLKVIPRIRDLAKLGHKIVYQNLFWAFFYNLAGIWLAMTGMLTPIFAAFAMVMSSLIVLFNAKRIR